MPIFLMQLNVKVCLTFRHWQEPLQELIQSVIRVRHHQDW